MENFFITLLTILYGFVGIIGTLGHIPIIKDLYIRKEININFTTYVIWTFTSFVMMLYGIFVIDDMLFLIIAGLGTIFCIIVLVLGFSIKRTKKNQFLEINNNQFIDINKNIT